jgi:phosphoribosylanthranilate isomerase
MWVKICANTSLEDALMAADAGADAVGFVFAESVRRVTFEQVAAITPHLPAPIERIGVFVDAGLPDLIEAVEVCGLTGLQLHSMGDPELAQRLRGHFGSRLRILQVIHYQQGLEKELRSAELNPSIDGVLVDSRTATLLGGTGQRFDWQGARLGFAESATRLRLVVAGGLNAANVGEAIATLRPWGVDVASGVEASPGKKDPAKVRAFVENARVAAHPLDLAARVVV